ncbi:hypothetical protein [Lentibacillus sp. CBA3610]|uniref:hypothetical protein n=1 Tax=Lentibacillus sp. CBA3610 TaxID=2518176 RepID=UPI001595D567|nr:hypothetical protein [Lentibacillus sp. CBA3610]
MEKTWQVQNLKTVFRVSETEADTFTVMHPQHMAGSELVEENRGRQQKMASGSS